MTIPAGAAANPSAARELGTWLAGLAVLLPLVGVLIVKDVSGPLFGGTGGEDTNQYEYCGFHLLENTRFTPLPVVRFRTDDVSYPYGIDAVMQPWGVERDLLYAACRRLFGLGPWLQLYFLWSLGVSALGTAILLRRDFGFARATFAGFAATFLNFYALLEFPHHLNIAVVHWTTLSLVTDFLLARAAMRREPPSALLLLWRGALLLLALGQELGYVAGLALASFMLTALFVVFVWARAGSEATRPTLGTLACDVRARPIATVALAGLVAVGAGLYLPIVVQIVREANRTPVVPGGAWWAIPLRVVIPYFPFLNSDSRLTRAVLGDPEGIGEGSPGWFLIAIGVLGIWHARESKRSLRHYIPLFLLLALCIPYHPEYLPTLKIFPWFSHFRVGGRCTLVYPVALVLFALEIDPSRIASVRWPALLVGLGIVETITAYGLRWSYSPWKPGPSFQPFMETVKRAGGEAVLDWPFCVAGGNGVGSHALCPYYFRNATIYTYRRFHTKKVMGEYFSRLQPSQVAPYLQAGWGKLYAPDVKGLTAHRQTRCFSAEEWSFFTRFYETHRFAGINLYPELLPSGCAEQFHERFGEPSARTELIGVGAVEFIPRKR